MGNIILRDNLERKNTGLLFFVKNPYVKYQNPSLFFVRKDARTSRKQYALQTFFKVDSINLIFLTDTVILLHCRFIFHKQS